MIRAVSLSRRAKKDIRRAPKHVVQKLYMWVHSVGSRGLDEVRKVPGWHDEPLRGQRVGQRSIRLNITYRAIYAIRRDGSVEFVSVEEVTPHDY